MALSHILSCHEISQYDTSNHSNLFTYMIYETFIGMSIDKSFVNKNIFGTCIDTTTTMVDKDVMNSKVHTKNMNIDISNTDNEVHFASSYAVSRTYESSNSSAASSPMSDVRHSISDVSSSDTDNVVFTDVPFIQSVKTLVETKPVYHDKYFRRYRRKIREYMRYDMCHFTIEYKDISYIRYVAHVDNKLFVIEFDFNNTERYEDNLHCSCKIIFDTKTLSYFHTRHSRRLYRSFADIVENDLAIRFPSIVPYRL